MGHGLRRCSAICEGIDPMAARNNNIWKFDYIFQGLYVGFIRIFINLFHPFRLGNIELQQINYILI